MKRNIKQLFINLLMLSGVLLSLWITWPLFQSGFLKFQGNFTVNDAADWMGICGVLLIVLLIWSSQTNNNPSLSKSSVHDPRLIRISIICAIGLLVATAVFNIWVNPWYLYGTEFFPSRTNPSRRQKLAYYAQIEKTPDLIVTGNSTAFTISPQYIQKTLGYSSFNWSIDGGRAANNQVLLEYLTHQYPEDFPKVILMQVHDTPIVNNFDRTPYKLLPYLSPHEMLTQGVTRASKLVSISQWADSMYVLRFTITHSDKKFSGWAFNEDGFGYKYNSSFSKVLSPEQINNYTKCTVPNVYRDENIEGILELLDEQNSSVVFYISPLLPEFYDTSLKEAQDYQNCHQTIVDYFTELSKSHSNVFFENYLVLENMQGLDSPEGFYDERHPTPENGERLIDALADTLQQAYAIAEMQQGTDTRDIQ